MADDQVFQANPLPISGDIAPTGFFDPLGLSNGKDIYTLKQWREAELKVIVIYYNINTSLLNYHSIARPCMYACLSWSINSRNLKEPSWY